MNQPSESPEVTARRLLRGQATASLSSLMAADAWPYASLVLVAVDHDGAPILLISALAEHTRNIQADARVALLFDGTAGLEEPLTGARLSLLGQAELSREPRLRARFLARHPGAALYADFKDFAFYRIAPARAHLVAGFGRIHWIEPDRLMRPLPRELIEAEAGIVAHMNQDHRDAIQLYANRLLGRAGDGWVMTGCDAEGCDLRQGGEVARVDFAEPALNAEQARAELVRLVREARRQLNEN